VVQFSGSTIGVQRIPFRFRSEPKAPHSQFLQLNWVFGEFLVRPEVVAGLKGAGITGDTLEPALHHKTSRALETIGQMVISSALAAGLDIGDLQPVSCKPDNEEGPPWYGGGQPRYPKDYPYCGRVEYHWPQGPALRFRRRPFASAPEIVKSFERFGSGGSASQAALISERAVGVIEAHRWRGVAWREVEFAD